MRITGSHGLLALGLTLLAQAAAIAAPYNIVSENTVNIALPIGTMKMTETVVQDGPLPINRFRMHRLRRANFSSRGTVLLLPALGNNFNGYLTGDGGDFTKSFAGYLARLGYEVWGYSPRETGLQGGQCGVVLDCSPALQWSLQTTIDDVAFIRGKIQSIVPGKKPVIGGLSLGAITAMAVVNQHPNDYAGLLAWEGSLITEDAAIRAHNQGFCTQFAGMVAGGLAVDDQSLPFVKLVNQFALASPDAPFAIPVPGFPPGLTNRQAWVLILSAPNPVAPSPRPGFVSAAGDFTTGTLFHSSPERLAANIAAFNDVTANRVVQDLYCSLAGQETAYVNNLSNFRAPVMIIQGGLGFGSIMDELPAKLGSTSVTMNSIHNFGHVDHLGSGNHLFLLEAPVAQWLKQVYN